MKAFGYVEELAMTKLALAELEEQFAAMTTKQKRNSWEAFTLSRELAECREYLAELEAT